MLDRELLSALCVFLGNLPREEELSALLGWQMLAAEGSTIGEVPRKASPGGKVLLQCNLVFFILNMYVN